MDGNLPKWFIGLILIGMLAIGIIMNAGYANGQTINEEIDVCSLLNAERQNFDKLSSAMEDMYKLGEIKHKDGKISDEVLRAIEIAIKHYKGLSDKTNELMTEVKCMVGEPG